MGTSGLISWITSNVVPLLALVAGAAVLFHGKNGNISKGITIGACVLIGFFVIALANPAVGPAIGAWIANLIKV